MSNDQGRKSLRSSVLICCSLLQLVSKPLSAAKPVDLRSRQKGFSTCFSTLFARSRYKTGFETSCRYSFFPFRVCSFCQIAKPNSQTEHQSRRQPTWTLVIPCWILDIQSFAVVHKASVLGINQGGACPTTPWDYGYLGASPTLRKNQPHARHLDLNQAPLPHSTTKKRLRDYS